MALSEFYESTIIKVGAYFVCSDFTESPDEITDALGIEPNDIRRKGDLRKLKNGKEIEERTNQWSIESSSDSKDINIHVRQLLHQLEGKEGLVKNTWNPSISILWKGNYLYAGSGPFYEKDVIEGIAKIGAELWQDIYHEDEKI